MFASRLFPHRHRQVPGARCQSRQSKWSAQLKPKPGPWWLHKLWTCIQLTGCISRLRLRQIYNGSWLLQGLKNQLLAACSSIIYGMPKYNAVHNVAHIYPPLLFLRLFSLCISSHSRGYAIEVDGNLTQRGCRYNLKIFMLLVILVLDVGNAGVGFIMKDNSLALSSPPVVVSCHGSIYPSMHKISQSTSKETPIRQAGPYTIYIWCNCIARLIA